MKKFISILIFTTIFLIPGKSQEKPKPIKADTLDAFFVLSQRPNKDTKDLINPYTVLGKLIRTKTDSTSEELFRCYLHDLTPIPDYMIVWDYRVIKK